MGMKINSKAFAEAMEIISNSPSRVTLVINEPVHDNYSNVYPIILKQACPALIDRLVEKGFSIGICEKGAYVDKF